MNPAYLSPKTLQIAHELLEWAKQYLMAENPNIKRPYNGQIVCPFVESSIQNDFFYFVFHTGIGANERLIEEMMLDYLDDFPRLEPFDLGRKLMKALLVVFPDIPKEQTNILDVVHRNIKNKFVEAGLMIGQFHPKCKEKSIHNQGFLASLSPYPLIAIRNMAPHDIIFLDDPEHPEWFSTYNLRFGERFKEPDKLDVHEMPLLPYYVKARNRYVK
jgi:hypothetical protein